MQPAFTPVHTETSVDAAARAVRQWLMGAPRRSPFTLPPERQLAASLGINRGTLRSALRILETEGLVRPRQGSGYTARDYRDHGGPQLIPPLLERTRDNDARIEIYRDLLAVRRALAHALTERLAAHGRHITLDETVAAIDALDAAIREHAPVDVIARRDFAIVSALVHASDSDVLLLMLNPVRDVLLGSDDLVCAMFAAPELNLASWRVLLTVLRGLSMKSGLQASKLCAFVDDMLLRFDEATLDALRKMVTTADRRR
jgi:GntR family transcriptional repressor for pyruvate dehydrogenase complex